MNPLQICPHVSEKLLIDFVHPQGALFFFYVIASILFSLIVSFFIYFCCSCPLCRFAYSSGVMISKNTFLDFHGPWQSFILIYYDMPFLPYALIHLLSEVVTLDLFLDVESCCLRLIIVDYFYDF